MAINKETRISKTNTFEQWREGTNEISIRLGDTAPNFDAETTEGKINFYDYLGDSWGILFSHPSDYTPVCTTELGTVANYKPEFDKRNTKVIALSIDDLESHKGWVKDIEETQEVKLNYPIIADEDKNVSNLYGMIHPNEDNKALRDVKVCI